MKSNTRLYYSLLLPVFLHTAVNAQGIRIESGTQLVLTGTTNLVIQDCGLLNNGTLVPATSTIQFSGNTATATSFIGGTGTHAFNNLTLNKSANGLQLNASIAVSGTLTFLSGDSLFLNNQVLDLGTTGQLSGESETRRITGLTGGYVQRTQTITNPVNLNPGNLGLELSGTTDWGLTVIRRGHVPQSDGPYTSIARYFDFYPTNNSVLAATVKMFYFDAELSGLNEASLSAYTSSNFSTNWQFINHVSSDATLNFVTTPPVNQLYRLTLASTLTPLPLYNIQLVAAKTPTGIRLQWELSSGKTINSYVVERSLNGIDFTAIGTVSYSANTATKSSFTDFLPQPGLNYYRIATLDLNGQKEKSKTVKVLWDVAETGNPLIYPVPAKGALTLVVNDNSLTGTKAAIFSIDGKLVNWLIITGETQLISGDHLAPGQYIIRFRNGKTVRFEKQ